VNAEHSVYQYCFPRNRPVLNHEHPVYQKLLVYPR
jgi:hypothetical protein